MTTPAEPEVVGRRFERFATFASDIKISHSVFALPWAVLATFMAADAATLRGDSRALPRLGQVLLIVACMVFARTVAMSANRLLDAKLDAMNPRTARRAIPSGRLSPAFVWTALLISAVAFIAATAGFGFLYHNWIPLIASVLVLLFVCAYPLLKRFTQLCHYYLGAALALAPVCAWVAIAGRLAIEPLLMAGAVLLWTAGFDIIYACQDYESDRATGVVSVPSRFGIAGALWIARITHAGCVALLIALGLVSPVLNVLYFCGVGLAVGLLVIEHAMVRPNDLSKVNVAFFTINGIISVILGTLGVLDVLW
jgi:4-hydroxybenzoate polyprenyltransferase